MQIPDYAVFAQMPVSARRQSLDTIKRFAGQHAVTLFLQVYQFDPDDELRELARRELAAQGITPPTEPTPMRVNNVDAAASIGGGNTPFSFTNVLSFTTTATDVPPGFDQEIEGGTGRPVQRGPQLANVFTLYRGHKKYVIGEANHIPHNPFAYLLTIGIFAFIFVAVFFALRLAGGTIEVNGIASKMTESNFVMVMGILGVIFCFVIAICGLIWWWNIRRNRRYETEGTLLLGEILNASGRWVTSTDSEGSTSRSYKVTVNYLVRLTDGQRVENTATHTRGDLARGGIPARGTPVAVIVISRDDMRLL